MLSRISGIRIESLAVAVPTKWMSLDDQFGKTGIVDERTLKKFKKNVGVEGRYLSSDKQTSSDWCFEAAEQILKKTKIDRTKIGVLVYVTQTPDYQQPATAHVLQYRLGLGQDCIVFDMNLGCSGFVNGLNVVGSLMMQSQTEYGLLLCGEIATRGRIRKKKLDDDTEQMIFGDAGSATLLVKDEQSEDMIFMSKADGERFRAIIKPWGYYRNPAYGDAAVGKMDGVSVFNFSTNEVPDLINELMSTEGTSSESYDYLVLHQANKLIMKQIERKIGFPEEKSLIAIDTFANTSSSSIPVSIVHNLADAKEKRKSHFLLSGYGIGLSWNVVDCYFDTNNIIPLIMTDKYYEDGYQAEQ